MINFANAPQYLLLTQARSPGVALSQPGTGGIWRFVLEQIGGPNRIEVSEMEPGVWGERLQLLAVIRGLEALEQPSRVTLITPSRFVGNGIRRNLRHWRECHWQWERFGEMTLIKNLDLWKRVDQAMQIHQLDCRIWDFDSRVSAIAKQPAQTSANHFGIEPRLSPRNDRAAKNRITFEDLESSRKKELDQVGIDSEHNIPIKPIGQGRAFGLCPA